MHKIWKIKESDENLVRNLVSELGISPLIAKLLVNRGITKADPAREFLSPDLSYLHAPRKMRGISEAIDRIKKAIADGERIWIYGDYDVDGITAVSLLISCLKHLGADVNYYIPNRLDEGYGLSKEGVADLESRGCRLMITVDCGIGAAEEVKMANEAGMDVIVTDHHEPRGELPPALVTLNPKLEECNYPFDGLSGVGVAFKLAQGLMGDENGQDEAFLREQFDLVALGTIADVVPLIGENRVIARYGLEVLNKRERVGIKALCDVADIKEDAIIVWTVGFRLGPRINAAGRIDTAHCAVQLLTTDSYDEALEIAQKLDAANRERQNIERSIFSEAKEALKQVDLKREKGLVVAKEGWHPGVVGIVASRLQEHFYRPAVVISLDGEEGRGSARSIPEFNIFHALTKCSHLLEGFGGHKAAAGLNISRDNIDRFRREFSQIVADTLEPDDLKPKVLIDAEASLMELSEDVVEQLDILEPYGLSNPRPLLSLTGLMVKGLPRTVGKNGSHLKMVLSDGRISVGTIGFGKGNIERELYDKGARIDLVCNPSINNWNGNKSVELRIEEIVVHRESGYDVMAASAQIMDLSQFKIVDRRGIPDKRSHLRKLLSMEQKTLMYVRDDMAVDQLQGIVSKYSPRTKLGLCYSGTPAVEIDQMKVKLIEGELDAIASPVPFEEPLPELKHLVFCHPVPTREYFVRCCAPAVESEEMVYIHLIFNDKDVEYLTSMLNQQYPDREMLANVYRKLREICSEGNAESVYLDQIAEGMELEGSKELIISNCVAILEDLELAKPQQINGKLSISLSPTPAKKRELQESQLYAAGEMIKREWSEFSRFIISKKDNDFRRILLETIS
jgi:single-stranded-DNA-specific exonuclease